MALLFLVEDNEGLAEAVTGYLEIEGHEVNRFTMLRGLAEAITMKRPDLIILDVMLPDGDGFLAAKRIRKEHKTPIIFLTARSSETDRITGLEIGADDYMVKPFSMREMVLRVRSVLARTSGDREKLPARYRWVIGSGDDRGTLELDEPSHLCFHNQIPVKLTAAEWKILLYLASQPQVVVSREVLLGRCLDYFADGSERSINTHIKNIRLKLGTDRWIETVRGFGYRFAGTAEDHEPR